MGVGFTLPIQIKNEAGEETYFENTNGYWHKYEYNSAGKETYFKNGDGFCRMIKYNSAGKETYREDNNGYWCKSEYDSSGNETYYENSGGHKTGTPRSAKTCEGKVVEIDGVKYELKTINN